MEENEAPKSYPVQFKDKIDEYLWREHRLLGGCCSSVESMKYAVAREVAEKLTDDLIERACEWLSDNLQTIRDIDSPSEHHVETIPELGAITQTEFLEKFKKEIHYLLD